VQSRVPKPYCDRSHRRSGRIGGDACGQVVLCDLFMRGSLELSDVGPVSTQEARFVEVTAVSNPAALLLIIAMTTLLWFAPVPATPRCDPLMALPWVKC
jgi:hypothetical protein